jgi:hypothetical protein
MGAPRNYNKQLCDEIQAFIDSPLCRTNTDVRRRFKMNSERLKKLQDKGLLKLKPTVSKTMVARMGNAAYKGKQMFPLQDNSVVKYQGGVKYG